MGKTNIEWTDYSWPVVNGCRRVSPGCGGVSGVGGCYAERLIATRLNKTQKYEGLAVFGPHGPRWTGKSRLWLKSLDEPLRIKKPSKIFVADMGDLFFEENSNEDIAAVFGVMAQAPRHTFQVLTKRPERMRQWFEWVAAHEQEHGPPPDVVVTTCAANLIDIDQVQRPWPLPNVWLGVSVESQQWAEERIPILAQVPAAVRFLSCEPLLGPLNLFGPKLADTGPFGAAWVKRRVRWETDYGIEHDVELTAAVDWVIVGGESGPGARPFDVAWALDIVEQCRAAKVACFVKQFGTKPVDQFLSYPLRLRNRKGGDPSEWPGGPWPRQFPEG